MPQRAIAADVRDACIIHARLLDAFIDLTKGELNRLPPGFIEESLLETLEMLRVARRLYGSLGGVTPVRDAA